MLNDFFIVSSITINAIAIITDTKIINKINHCKKWKNGEKMKKRYKMKKWSKKWKKTCFLKKNLIKHHFFFVEKKVMVVRSFRFLMSYRNNHYDNQVPKMKNRPTIHAKKPDFYKKHFNYGSKKWFYRSNY